MTSKRSAAALLLMSVFAVAAACAPPKQAEVVDVESESGVDMAPSDAAPEQGAGTAPEQDEMRTKCCAECKAGLAKDRSGSAPDTIPCADFTDTLSPWCLEHFRGSPLMASRCQ